MQRRCRFRFVPSCRRAVIPGAIRLAEVKQNVARMSARIPADLWSELKREKLLDAGASTPN